MDYGITPSLDEIAGYGLPARYWGCHAVYLPDQQGFKRIEIPENRETYWGFTDKLSDADGQSDLMGWVNGAFLPGLRMFEFEAPLFRLVDSKFLPGKVYVGIARVNKGRDRLRIGVWERQPQKQPPGNKQ